MIEESPVVSSRKGICWGAEGGPEISRAGLALHPESRGAWPVCWGAGTGTTPHSRLAQKCAERSQQPGRVFFQKQV